jgi:hypothetical protein
MKLTLSYSLGPGNDSRDLNQSQRAAIAVFRAGPEERRLIEGIKAEAKERERAGKRIEQPCGTLSTGSGEKSRDLIGKRYNVNGRYISDLEAVAKAIDSLEDLEKRPEAPEKRVPLMIPGTQNDYRPF